MNTETKHTHTQGPWRAHVAHANLVTHSDFVCTESGLHVCDVASYGESPDKRNANARLIAAAPELLQVTRDFLLLAALHDWEGAAIDFAKATVAKVEGNA